MFVLLSLFVIGTLWGVCSDVHYSFAFFSFVDVCRVMKRVEKVSQTFYECKSEVIENAECVYMYILYIYMCMCIRFSLIIFMDVRLSLSHAFAFFFLHVIKV